MVGGNGGVVTALRRVAALPSLRGAALPTPDWGVMIVDGRKYLREAWWASTFPGIAILLTAAFWAVILLA